MTKLSGSLADKLHSLGVMQGTHLPAPKNKPVISVSDVVHGEFLLTEFGEVFCTNILLNNAYTHGKVPMQPVQISRHLLAWNNMFSKPYSIDPYKLVFLDTETTGLSGGTGTLPFMIGLGWFTENGFTTRQIFIRNPAEEPAQLALLDKYLANASGIVTYNGKSFDIPIMNTRFVINGLVSPLKDIPHFDLLPLARRFWRRRLVNRSLKDIETEILGFFRSQLEVPGWEVPVIYFNFLRTLDPTPLVGVFYHNAVDIQSLAALFLHVNTLLSEPSAVRLLPLVDQLSLAIFLEDLCEIDHTCQMYEDLLEQDLPDEYYWELRFRYGLLSKRKGDFDKAVQVWDDMKAKTDIRVLLQLAKTLEHKYRDYDGALLWTNHAIELINHTPKLGKSKNNLLEDFQKRRARLEIKLETNDG